MLDPHLRRILLINPNSSRATTDMMVAIARATLPAGFAVDGVTAQRSPPMIVTRAALEAAGPEVVAIGLAQVSRYAGVIVSAFGDPGLAELRTRVAVPAVGICEASMLAAAQGGRRFGVATVTPDLALSIAERAAALGLAELYTGIRCTPDDPVALAGDASRLQDGLEAVVRACIDRDGAEAVIIGGGPLGEAAAHLRPMFATPIIAPIPCAVERLLGMVGDEV
ncbi:MAG TPA: aspartate/glutamate racemase family protein [Acetobacteraceae bacterium]|jgi:Asp/Glu/hydantoin racemase|nr:aspartate/glutamate racemase family protein [Acetobacteraceae bacterium]